MQNEMGTCRSEQPHMELFRSVFPMFATGMLATRQVGMAKNRTIDDAGATATELLFGPSPRESATLCGRCAALPCPWARRVVPLNLGKFWQTCVHACCAMPSAASSSSRASQVPLAKRAGTQGKGRHMTVEHYRHLYPCLP